MSPQKKGSRAEKFGTSEKYWRKIDGKREPYHANLSYRSITFDREIFISVIENEYALRELAQRLEFLRKEIKGLEKMIDSEVNHSQLAQLNTELGEAQKKHALQIYQHYRAESLLAYNSFKDEYDSLRQDPSWYMRDELVQDCKDRGGCCSRACGCCAQRHLSPETKGLGHCTWDCHCCIYYRGFQFSEEEKEKARTEFGDNLRSWNPAYLLTMTNAFFTKVEPEPKPEPDSKPEPKPTPQPQPVPDRQTQPPRRWTKFWKR